MDREIINKVIELTDRRREVLNELLQDKTDMEIGEKLKISFATVRKHIQEICDHFDIESYPGDRRKKKRRKKLTELLKNNNITDVSIQSINIESINSQSMSDKFITKPESNLKVTNNDENFLDNRDYTLIIDQSASMRLKDQRNRRSRWEVIKEITYGLAIECTAIDTDNITVYTFADEFTRYDHVTESKVKQIFDEQEPKFGGTNLSYVLKDALNNYFERKKSSRNKKNGEVILVITDGKPDNEQLVEKVIIEATKKIEVPEELGISFIQIGYDREASEFLEYIDVDLIDNGAIHDICHTVPYDKVKNQSFKEIIYNAIYK